MIRAQKLSGMTLAMSYYSDYSEVRFRKLLISNIDYSNFQLSDFETPSPEDPSDNTDISWNELIPKKVNVDPFLKCASHHIYVHEIQTGRSTLDSESESL